MMEFLRPLKCSTAIPHLLRKTSIFSSSEWPSTHSNTSYWKSTDSLLHYRRCVYTGLCTCIYTYPDIVVTSILYHPFLQLPLLSFLLLFLLPFFPIHFLFLSPEDPFLFASLTYYPFFHVVSDAVVPGNSEERDGDFYTDIPPPLG